MDGSVSLGAILGPRSARYFGDGFRRVTHRTFGLRLESTGVGPAVSALTDVHYPIDWSAKTEDVELRPHLSTVDALVVAVELIDAILVGAMGLSPEQRASARLRYAKFRAGSAAQVHLDSIPVRAGIVAGGERMSSGSGVRSRFDCRVGSIQVMIEVQHARGRGHAPGLGTTDGLEDLLGAASSRLYGAGYRNREHTLEDAVITGETRRIAARVAVGQVGDDAPLGGLGGLESLHLSLVDCILAQSQLTQALLYSIDGITRAESDTLWMRHVELESEAAPPPLGEAFEAHVEVERSRLLRVDGVVFRRTEFTGEFGGIRSRYSLAHRVPPRIIASLERSTAA